MNNAMPLAVWHCVLRKTGCEQGKVGKISFLCILECRGRTRRRIISMTENTGLDSGFAEIRRECGTRNVCLIAEGIDGHSRGANFSNKTNISFR
jgi:hypothetical protein